MAQIKRIMCVCIGNSDRSPVMAAVLEMFLKNAGYEVGCTSVGISESANRGGGASPFAVTAAKRIGIDLTGHGRTQIASHGLDYYGLIICASDEIAAKVIELGADPKKVYNAQIPNPWPVQFQEDYDVTFAQILAAMYRVVARYFSQ